MPGFLVPPKPRSSEGGSRIIVVARGVNWATDVWRGDGVVAGRRFARREIGLRSVLFARAATTSFSGRHPFTQA